MNGCGNEIGCCFCVCLSGEGENSGMMPCDGSQYVSPLRWRDFFNVIITSMFIDEVLNLMCTCDMRWSFANTSRLFSFNELVGKVNNVLQWITIKHIPVCTLFQ